MKRRKQKFFKMAFGRDRQRKRGQCSRIASIHSRRVGYPPIRRFLGFYLSLLVLVSVCVCLPMGAFAAKELNLYVWYGEIPSKVIHAFERETGIHVNISTYDDNEVLYAKLKADPNSEYDIVEPSSYYVNRMRRDGLLQPINHQRLPHLVNLDPTFANPPYDPNNAYSIPYLWGVTGIFVNQKYINPNTVTDWSDLWQRRFRNEVMLLDDPREVFSMSLISLGYSPNAGNLVQIKEAYQHLLTLLPNIKLFNSDAIPSIFIDEDATIGMAWNGDIYRAHQINPNLHFIYPKSGFVIWVDCFAIPKQAPHLANAYRFLDFMLRAKSAAPVTLIYGYPTANRAARQLLPKRIRENPIIFPSAAVLKRGHFQTDIDNHALDAYAKYWTLLKLNA